MVKKSESVETPSSAEAAPADNGAKVLRKFRTAGLHRVGILFSGGPAPAANAVISSAVIQLLNERWDVVGFYKGYENLESFDKNHPRNLIQDKHYRFLQFDDVTRLRATGGCFLKTARANPARTAAGEIKNEDDLHNPEKTAKLLRVLDALEYLGIGALISIGGDDTLKTAYYLSRLGVPTVHVPKTIDNDYFGIPWTFGYFSAIERARQDVKVFNEEARTTDCYFIIEMMGRKAGWYTLGAGIAAEAVRMVGPEEVGGDKLDIRGLADELAGIIIKRENDGKNCGVILISEGLADKLPEEDKPKTVDEHGNIRLSEAKIGEHIARSVESIYKRKTGRPIKIKTDSIGYTTRCMEPTAYDVILGSQLGRGAYKLIKEGKFGNMVSVDESMNLKSVPFGELIDPNTFKTRLRFVPAEGDFAALAKSLEYRRFEK